MNLEEIIIIATILSILLGCMLYKYGNDIYDYISNTTIDAYDKYDVKLMDDSDVKYIKKFVSDETLQSIVDKLDLDGSANMSCPNAKIDENALLNQTNKYGTELPWDLNVTSCNVLRNTDKDLYGNVENSRIITFY